MIKAELERFNIQVASPDCISWANSQFEKLSTISASEVDSPFVHTILNLQIERVMNGGVLTDDMVYRAQTSLIV